MINFSWFIENWNIWKCKHKLYCQDKYNILKNTLNGFSKNSGNQIDQNELFYIMGNLGGNPHNFRVMWKPLLETIERFLSNLTNYQCHKVVFPFQV